VAFYLLVLVSSDWERNVCPASGPVLLENRGAAQSPGALAWPGRTGDALAVGAPPRQAGRQAQAHHRWPRNLADGHEAAMLRHPRAACIDQASESS